MTAKREAPFTPQAIKCPKCLERAELQDWLPATGFDPLLRRYVCKRCGTTIYKRLVPVKD